MIAFIILGSTLGSGKSCPALWSHRLFSHLENVPPTFPQGILTGQMVWLGTGVTYILKCFEEAFNIHILFHPNKNLHNKYF